LIRAIVFFTCGTASVLDPEQVLVVYAAPARLIDMAWLRNVHVGQGSSACALRDDCSTAIWGAGAHCKVAACSQGICTAPPNGRSFLNRTVLVHMGRQAVGTARAAHCGLTKDSRQHRGKECGAVLDLSDSMQLKSCIHFQLNKLTPSTR
jgi:hypothetical protein